MIALTVADYVARAVLAGCVSRVLWVWLSLEAIERRKRMIELAHEHGSFRALRGAIGDTMALRKQANAIVSGAMWIPVVAAPPALWIGARWWGAL